MKAELRTAPGMAALSRAGADEFSRCAREAVAARDRFAVALSGGSTPRGVFSLLAQANNLSWNKMYFFFGDERHVPPTDPESNYRMANESLISKVPIPPQNVHRIHTELEATVAADQYEAELKKFFQGHSTTDGWPRFDLIMLGMGPDGHTASLFPGTAALNEKSRWVAANWVEKLNTWRITFTFPVINYAAEVLFLVAGEEKAEVLKDVFEGKPGKYPCQNVQPINGRLLWIVDKIVARLL